MGRFSGTSEDQTMMFRCGCHGHSGCGKVLTEGQIESNMKCPRCGSHYFSSYSPQTKWQAFKCYLKLMIRGEAWVR